MDECKLCRENESGYLIKKYSFWSLGVCPYQHTLGTLVIINNAHKELFSEITNEELFELKDIVGISYKALEAMFHPDWFNLQQNGNWERHLHIQILPRYKDERIFAGKVFVDQSFGEPVEYTKKTEEKIFIDGMTRAIKENIFDHV